MATTIPSSLIDPDIKGHNGIGQEGTQVGLCPKVLDIKSVTISLDAHIWWLCIKRKILALFNRLFYFL